VDWVEWHAAYDDDFSELTHRLRIVQTLVRAALDGMPAGPVTVISMCAGQGRDLIEAAAAHPRRADVRARLVELDPGNVAVAREMAAAAGLDGVEVVEADAGRIDAYAGWVPADLVLACGVFGNLTDADVLRTVDACASLCRAGGTVVWTRHRDDPDPVPAVCERFEARGFERLLLTPPELGFSVGAHRRVAAPEPVPAGERMFTFVGSDVLRALTRPSARNP
jgi:predicted RNA methylase